MVERSLQQPLARCFFSHCASLKTTKDENLGFTNATAFSPTDVMPLTHRAKYAMLVQSTVALALFGLVVARAVNAFT